ncbi:hexaprenyldihydroxybenzoate methyltransferase [Schizosaccharomyces cryophilus OY26]|uniref:Hexaprenyldihydroxybenzoate methyltransferase n=1 Tax=Schizosaccharomyces cryophilus (strain OY26 / ATCC MYA-4695 / CBS 11777 / NBRC 106824 / NRRL Y48691) TaxID=653667 RepID=S9VNP1_SCHCR|nr:hexaprenyldihydroxybenzoate methyltransferase [Schizosaccharomyces cryophilus OY26]EPY49593.1 hexaprenyldihydroxybenzoate methyltransferase [Schizosaccharomyces cryophilus OY26]
MPNLTDLNVTYFNAKKAHEYDNPSTLAVTKIVAGKILQLPTGSASRVVETDKNLYEQYSEDSVDLNEAFTKVDKFWESKSISLLDFACGTGLISENLAPYCESILGLDISQAMVDKFNHKFQTLNVPIEKAHAEHVDLRSETEPSDRVVGKYDVAVCSMAYHHMTDVDFITKKLKDCLKSSGRLYVVDFLKGAGSFHENMPAEFCTEHGIGHPNGFTQQELIQCFEIAGFEDVVVSDGFQIKVWVDEEKYHKSTSNPNPEVKQLTKDKVVYAVKIGLIIASGRKPQ